MSVLKSTTTSVVAIAGGTVDVSVHEKNLDGTLKELHRASGGPWGGTCVDNNFIVWLTTLCGVKAMEKLKREAMDDYLDLLREFENKKRTISLETSRFITFKMSAALKDFIEENDEGNLTSKIDEMNLKDDVKIQRDKLRVSADVARGWFKEPIDSTTEHINAILSEPEMTDVSTVLLVGGFAECHLVQEAIKNVVGNRTVFIPEEAGLAVLNGAVTFGHQPRIVASRCVRYTYGYKKKAPFDESKHPHEKMEVDSYGKQVVKGCFKKIVEIGTSVEVGKTINTPRSSMGKHGRSYFKIYASTERDPLFVTDPSCRLVGRLKLGHAPGETKEENKIEKYFTFGDTELMVSVKILKTGQVLTKVLDCL